MFPVLAVSIKSFANVPPVSTCCLCCYCKLRLYEKVVKWSHCRSALNLHFIYRPPGEDLASCKKNDCEEVIEKNRLVWPYWLRLSFYSVNKCWIQLILFVNYCLVLNQEGVSVRFILCSWHLTSKQQHGNYENSQLKVSNRTLVPTEWWWWLNRFEWWLKQSNSVFLFMVLQLPKIIRLARTIHQRRLCDFTVYILKCS